MKCLFGARSFFFSLPAVGLKIPRSGEERFAAVSGLLCFVNEEVVVTPGVV